MEAQLAAYRARRAKEHSSTKSSLFSTLFRKEKQSDINSKVHVMTRVKHAH